jgi:hypothetical protein
MRSLGAFTVDLDERTLSVLVEVGELNRPSPVRVHHDLVGGTIGDLLDLTLRLSPSEAEDLWRLLDETIGDYVRDRERERQIYEGAKQAGLLHREEAT